MELLGKGGPVLWIILGLSVITIAIILEKILYLKRIKVDEDRLFSRIKSALTKRHFDEALSICDGQVTPLSGIMKAGIEHRNEDSQSLREVLKDASNQEVPILEKNLSALGTIAHIAPLLGLLGTVTGNIDAFGVLGNFGSVSDPSLLAKGISEALITTAAGLIVSIPSVVLYNYFVRKINLILIKMENKVNEMILLLKDSTGSPSLNPSKMKQNTGE